MLSEVFYFLHLPVTRKVRSYHAFRLRFFWGLYLFTPDRHTCPESLSQSLLLARYYPRGAFTELSAFALSLESDILLHMDLDGYFAGFFDGEGCIMVNRYASRIETRTPRYQLRVTVTNTHHGILKRFQEVYGGTIHRQILRNGKESPKWQPRWLWVVSSEPAANFLSRIEPFLMVKHEEAAEALRFREYQRSIRSLGHPYPDEVVKELARFKERITALKRRDPPSELAT